MTDPQQQPSRRDAPEQTDDPASEEVEAVEDLDVDEDAEAIHGGNPMDEEGQPQIE